MDIWGFQKTFVLMNYKKPQLKVIEYLELEGWPTRIISVQVLALHWKTPGITPCVWWSCPYKGLANCPKFWGMILQSSHNWVCRRQCWYPGLIQEQEQNHSGSPFYTLVHYSLSHKSQYMCAYTKAREDTLEWLPKDFLQLLTLMHLTNFKCILLYGHYMTRWLYFFPQ